MKKLSAVLLTLAVLAGCSPSPKVVATYETDTFKATFTDAKCSDKKVLSVINEQAQMAEAMGMPHSRVLEIKAKFKQGTVHINEENRDLAFCYITSDDGSSASVVDENGNGGMVPLEKK